MTDEQMPASEEEGSEDASEAQEAEGVAEIENGVASLTFGGDATDR